MTRIQRFRAYMARMNPVADPALAIKEGLYVEPPGRSVAEELALRLELEPASTHLVLGGIGSAKTTELLRAQERLQKNLSEAGDHVEYIDVSLRHDLTAPTLSGVLVALAGLALIQHLDLKQKRSLADPIKTVRHHAHTHKGYVVMDEENESYDDDPDLVEVPGALIPPKQPLPDHLEDLIPSLQALRSSYPGKDAHAIFLFDSLDRLPSPERFREALEHDLRVLKAAGIGVVVAGPSRFMVRDERAITDMFDHTYFQLPADPEQPAGLEFLETVLRRRAGADVLPDDCLEPLARASGGVMRDLIQLAKAAGSEAYARGHEPISREMVARAIDIFGRNLAVGLDDEQVKKLKHLQHGKGFVIRGERELSLIETRRVLFYGEARWKVHPALTLLLDAIPEAA